MVNGKLSVKLNCVKHFIVSLQQNKTMDVTIDSLKRIYTDNYCLLLNPSGTGALFRIYSDAMTQEQAD